MPIKVSSNIVWKSRHVEVTRKSGKRRHCINFKVVNKHDELQGGRYGEDLRYDIGVITSTLSYEFEHLFRCSISRSSKRKAVFPKGIVTRTRLINGHALHT